MSSVRAVKRDARSAGISASCGVHEQRLPRYSRPSVGKSEIRNPNKYAVVSCSDFGFRFSDFVGLLLLGKALVSGFHGTLLSLAQGDFRSLAADLDAQLAVQHQVHVGLFNAALGRVIQDGAGGAGALEVGALDLEGQVAAAA